MTNDDKDATPMALEENDELSEAFDVISGYLTQVKSMFGFESRLSLCVRAVGNPGLDFLVTEEEAFDELHQFVKRAEKRGRSVSESDPLLLTEGLSDHPAHPLTGE